MATFYRVLYSAAHVHLWNCNEFHSFHHEHLGEWIKTWKERESAVATKYPLKCRKGIFTQHALDAFLRIQSVKKANDKWTDDELRESSELAGVCAFRTPQSC
jgi:hypothetical protein